MLTRIITALLTSVTLLLSPGAVSAANAEDVSPAFTYYSYDGVTTKYAKWPIQTPGDVTLTTNAQWSCRSGDDFSVSYYDKNSAGHYELIYYRLISCGWFGVTFNLVFPRSDNIKVEYRQSTCCAINARLRASLTGPNP